MTRLIVNIVRSGPCSFSFVLVHFFFLSFFIFVSSSPSWSTSLAFWPLQGDVKNEIRCLTRMVILFCSMTANKMKFIKKEFESTMLPARTVVPFFGYADTSTPLHDEFVNMEIENGAAMETPFGLDTAMETVCRLYEAFHAC